MNEFAENRGRSQWEKGMRYEIGVEESRDLCSVTIMRIGNYLNG